MARIKSSEEHLVTLQRDVDNATKAMEEEVKIHSARKAKLVELQQALDDIKSSFLAAEPPPQPEPPTKPEWCPAVGLWSAEDVGQHFLRQLPQGASVEWSALPRLLAAIASAAQQVQSQIPKVRRTEECEAAAASRGNFDDEDWLNDLDKPRQRGFSEADVQRFANAKRLPHLATTKRPLRDLMEAHAEECKKRRRAQC